MPWFDIEPDGKEKGAGRRTFTVEAKSWQEAAQVAGQRLRPGEPLQDLLVEHEKNGTVNAWEAGGGLLLRIIPRARPGKKARQPVPAPDPEEHPTIRQSPMLVPRPRLVPGKVFATYSGPREALLREAPAPGAPPLPAPRPPPLPKKAPAGQPVTARGRALSREVPFELSPAMVGRVRRACWGGATPKTLETLVDLALELVPAEAAAAFLVAEDGDLDLVAAWGPRARRLMDAGLRLRPDVGIVGACVERRTLVLVPDVSADPRFLEDVARSVDYAVRTALAAPIATGERVVGVVELLNRKQGGPFTDADAVKLSRLAHVAGGFLERER